MKTIFPALCAALLLTPALALAAPANAGETWVDNDEGALVSEQSDGTREYIMEDDTVDGENFKPGGTQVRGVQGIRHESMISIRKEFLPHLYELTLDI